ncbi:CBN-ZTF-17 protein, partial [Aphelenchoides avenae]
MLCAYCGENQRSAGDYVRHCREVHDGKFEDFDETFANMADFETFREKLRLERNTEFVAMSGRNKNLDGSEYWRLVCVRSGKPDGRLKPKWTRKCGHWCTAHLRMKQFSDGRVQAIGCLDHTGHDVAYDGMYLSNSAQEEADGHGTASPSPSIQEPPSVADAEPVLEESVPSDSKAASSSEMTSVRRRHSCTAQIACAFCGLVLKTYADYVTHCIDSHSMQLDQIDRTFESLTDFETFRKELRVERKTELISTSGKKRKGGTFMWSLVCARSGKPQQGSKRTR